MFSVKEKQLAGMIQSWADGSNESRGDSKPKVPANAGREGSTPAVPKNKHWLLLRWDTGQGRS
jgi:hypothetical protein